MKSRSKAAYIISAPLITALILLIVYAIKGVFPFGNGNVLGGDLYQQGVFSFYYIIDAFKSGNLYYDFLTAGGFPRGIIASLFTPHYWPLLFIPRESVINYISVLVIIKFSVIALSAAFSFSKLFEKLPPAWITTVALIYAFSGYNIQYFTNLSWLDVVALYPLLIYGLKKMFDKKSKLLYVFILTYLLCIQTYLAFFVVVSLIVFVGLYILLLVEKEKQKEYIYSLGTGTLISVVSSSVLLFKNLASTFSTNRFENFSAPENEVESGALQRLLTIYSSGIKLELVSIIMFFGAEIAFAAIFILAFYSLKHKKSRKATAFFLISFLFFAIQAAVLASELIWHGGSRVSFPLRNGYMISFLACFCLCFFLQNNLQGINRALARKKAITFASPFILVLSTIILGFLANRYFAMTDEYSVTGSADALSAYSADIIFIIALITAMFSSILLLKPSLLKRAVAIILSAVIVCVNAYSFIGNYDGSEVNESYVSCYAECEDVKELLKSENNKLIRVANPDLSLLTNYAYYTQTPAVSNWTHSLSSLQTESLKQLGYGYIYTRVLDSGATAFSRALTGTRYSVSKAPLNERIYENTGEARGGFTKYKNRFTLPTGVFFDVSPEDISPPLYENTFEYQNAIFERLSGEKELFERITPENNLSGETQYVSFSYKGEKSYIKAKTYTSEIKTNKDSTLYLTINDPEVSVPSIKINENEVEFYRNVGAEGVNPNTISPAKSTHNIIELGSFDGETIDFSIDVLEGDSSAFVIYSMDNNKLASFCKRQKENDCTFNKDVITINANTDSSGYMFLPLTYNDNWSCTVNGKDVKISKALGDFILIPTESGANDIQLKFSHKSDNRSFLIILASFCLAVLLVLLESRIKHLPKWIFSVFYFAYTVLFCLAVSALYVLPVAFLLIL